MRYRATVLTALLLSALTISSAAQIPRELREAMQARLEAVWKKDAAAWSRLTADEFTVVIPEGRLMTKADRLTALKTEKPQPVHTVQREQIRAYGETVVRRFVDSDEWVLEVWVRQNGVWRVVAAQVNFATQPGEETRNGIPDENPVRGCTGRLRRLRIGCCRGPRSSRAG
jgi:hypothetical protein